MKRQLDRLKGKRLVTGDPNLMTKDEICINATPNGVEVKEIGTDGKIKDLAGSGNSGGGDSEEEHWVGIKLTFPEPEETPITLVGFNFTEFGRRLGSIYINKGIGMLGDGGSSMYGPSAYGGLLTYGDMITPFKSSYSETQYYRLNCVNIKKGERIIYSNMQRSPWLDCPAAPDYNFGNELFTLEEIENKILESKLFTNYPKNERIIAIMSIIGVMVMLTGQDEWNVYIPIDEYLTSMGIDDIFTSIEIVYPNKDEMLEFVKQSIIDYKG